MPVAPGKASKAQMQEVVLSDSIMRPEAPIVRCRIVYMGNNRNRSVALRGQIQVQNIQTGFDEKNEPIFETSKSAIEEGTQNYDFSSHDALGRIIAERLMAQESGPELAGKPFAFCEHIDHIRWFYEQKTDDGAKEFKILADRADQPIIQDHIRRFMASRAREENEFAEVASR